MNTYTKTVLTFIACSVPLVATAQTEMTDTTQVTLPGYDFDDTQLEEVVVTAKKKLIESDGATLTYNVEEDPDSKSSSVIEMLRKVPMVSVDADDNIRVKGQQNFKIFVNGKEDPMLSGDPKTVLKSMPANSIKKIEVITEPGAKYDAEGTGGILNIITDRKSALEGYLLNLNAGVNLNNGINSGVYGRTKIGNVTMSGNLSYNNSAGMRPGQEIEVNMDYLGDNPQNLNRKSDKAKNDNEFVNGSFNLSWEPDSLNLFTVSLYGGEFDGSQKLHEFDVMRSQSTADLNHPHNIIYQMEQNSNFNWNSKWLGSEFSFQHNFGRDNHNIVGSYIFNYGGRNNHNGFDKYNLVNYPSDASVMRSFSKGNYDKHALQLDYTNQLNEHHKLEVGFKGTWYPDHSNKYTLQGTSPENLASSGGYDDVSMRQVQNIVAAYSAYTGKFGRFGYRAGIRYENTHMGVSYKDGFHDSFSSDLNDFVPNAAINWGLGQNTFRAAYQMRISRPNVGQLNPYRDTSNLGVVEYGNPDLESERMNSVSVTWSNYGGKIGGQLQAGYSTTDNMINHYIFAIGDLLHQTYMNVGRHERINFSGNGQWTIIPMMNFGISAEAIWNRWKSSDIGFQIHSVKWSGNFNANWDYSLPKDFRASAYGGWGCFADMQQTKAASYYYYGINISRSFLKEKRLTLTLGAQNFLPTYRTFNIAQESEGMKMQMHARQKQLGVNFSISYRLGSLRKDVKKTAADIEKVSGGISGGGIGM